MKNELLFDRVLLSAEHEIFISQLIPEFNWGYEKFMQLWNKHPEQFHIVKMHGKEIPTPRWQQAYGKNYRYTGSQNNALPIEDVLQPFLDWSRENIDAQLNGLLLNWYDGTKGHYIGPHRDDSRDLIPDTPIVTVSLGEERIFRLRPYQGTGYKDLTLRNGEVLIIPWQTNQYWTHEVPRFRKYQGKRISITLRAFQ